MFLSLSLVALDSCCSCICRATGRSYRSLAGFQLEKNQEIEEERARLRVVNLSRVHIIASITLLRFLRYIHLCHPDDPSSGLHILYWYCTMYVLSANSLYSILLFLIDYLPSVLLLHVGPFGRPCPPGLVDRLAVLTLALFGSPLSGPSSVRLLGNPFPDPIYGRGGTLWFARPPLAPAPPPLPRLAANGLTLAAVGG